MNPIHLHSVDMSYNMVNVNINAVLHMSRFFLPIFEKRFKDHKKRSAVINVSSVAALGAQPMTTVYGATKAFDRIFSLGMQKEYGNFLDVLTVLPLSTKSSMNSGRYLGTVTSQQHGRAVINQLGWKE